MSSPIEIQLTGPGLHDGIPARLQIFLRPPTVPGIPSPGTGSHPTAAGTYPVRVKSGFSYPGKMGFPSRNSTD